MLLDFVPYQINSRAPDGGSFLWFGSEVDIVLVSISKMNQENEGSVLSPTVLLHMCLILSLPMEYAISQPSVARCSPRRPRNRCLLSLLERKSSFFNCNVMERLSITFRPSHPARRACMLSFVEAPALSQSNTTTA